MTVAIEPMLCAGSHETKILPNGWTTVTRDGRLSAHAEHTIAITEEGAEVLTALDQEDDIL
jgi:methionyl aminopeptidase